MKLIDYLNSLPLAEREPFAARCGTSFDYLRQVGYGNRPCKESLAIKLERESDRALTCEELCPAVDWAFIRGTAPACTAISQQVSGAGAGKGAGSAE